MTNGQLLNCGGSTGGVMRAHPVPFQTLNTSLSLSHAMDRPPDLVLLQLTNLVAENGWSPGESLNLYAYGDSFGGANWSATLTPGRVAVLIPASISIANKATNGFTTLTQANWIVGLAAIWFAPLPPSL